MLEKAKDWLKNRLSEERYLHSLGAAESARKLAERFSADADRTEFAALIHDNAKCFSGEELIKIIENNKLPVSDMEKNSFKTLHAPVGAYLAQIELGVNDTEILDAIRWHTIGKINMSKLEKIVFLSDKIEPYTRDKEFRDKILNVLNDTGNLDEAILVCYDATIRSLLDRRLIINTQTINVWNDLLIKLKNSK